MSQRPLISIIVPVYNVELYMDQCIDSIVSQSYDNLEIILVDDGSTDSSGKKCDLWKDRDNRIVVIHKENEGVSVARNVGLNVAKGSYISFIDSDDYIDITMYESLVNLIINEHAQVAGCQFVEVSDKGFSNDMATGKTYRFSGREACNCMLRCDEELPRVIWSAWVYLFACDIAKSVLFEKGVSCYEDGLYTLQAIWKASKVVFLDKNMYFYRLREGSATRISVTTKFVEDMIHFNSKRLEFYQKNATQEEINKCRWHAMMDILHCRYNCYAPSDRHKVMQFYRLYDFGYADLKGRGVKNVARYVAYRYFWRIYRLLRNKIR